MHLCMWIWNRSFTQELLYIEVLEESSKVCICLDCVSGRLNFLLVQRGPSRVQKHCFSSFLLSHLTMEAITCFDVLENLSKMLCSVRHWRNIDNLFHYIVSTMLWAFYQVWIIGHCKLSSAHGFYIYSQIKTGRKQKTAQNF